MVKKERRKKGRRKRGKKKRRRNRKGVRKQWNREFKKEREK